MKAFVSKARGGIRGSETLLGRGRLTLLAVTLSTTLGIADIAAAQDASQLGKTLTPRA